MWAQRTPTDAADWPYQQALQLREAKDYEGALTVLEGVLAQSPNNDKYLALAATLYRALGRYEQCEQFARRAIALNPNPSWYYATYAFGAYQNQDFDLARPALQKVLAMGAAKVGQGNFDTAQKYLDDLEAKNYTITWDIKPVPQMMKDGFITLPAPQTDLPYQSAVWEIKGARQWHTTQENGNTMIEVEPEGEAPFQFIVNATVTPHSFKGKMAKADNSRLPEDVRPFLTGGRKANSGPQILAVAASVKADEALTTVRNTVRWLEQNFKYERGTFTSAEEAITRGYGDCGAYSTIFTSLCQANGIPARAVWGATKDALEFTPEGHLCGHVWAEFYLPGSGWIPVEPQQLAKVGYIGTGRVTFYRGVTLANSVSRTLNRTYDTYTPAYTETPAK